MFFNGCSNIDELTSALNSIKDNATNSSGNNNTSLTEEKITVWFDTQQSSIPNWSIFIDNGSLIPEPENPVLENYTFLGWYDNNVNGNLWNFNTPCTKDITLYAMWEKVKKVVKNLRKVSLILGCLKIRKRITPIQTDTSALAKSWKGILLATLLKQM